MRCECCGCKIGFWEFWRTPFAKSLVCCECVEALKVSGDLESVLFPIGYPLDEEMK